MGFKKIPRTVVILGLVSFFNDVASEMVYPIVPIFLTIVLHTPVPILGFIEGFAEATASIGKYLFGTYSDYLKKRKIFVTLGYFFSAISKPLIGLSFTWPLVLFARFIDRFGKGLRTAPRDSLLLENATPQNKGFIFGFHRAFDSLGAVLGPLGALVTLYFLHNNLRLIFLIAFIPGIIAIFLLGFLVKEKKKIDLEKKELVKINWKLLAPRLRLFLLISFIFALGNSSDTFLLLNAKHLGLSTTRVVLVYVLYNLSQTLFATPAGFLSDKLGARKIFSGGLFVFAIVYLFFGIAKSPFWMWVLFPLYGIYIASTDGVSKAYISEFIAKKESGTFFGAYYFLTAIGTFFASIIGGLLWSIINPSATFLYGSAMAALAFVILFIGKDKLHYSA